MPISCTIDAPLHEAVTMIHYIPLSETSKKIIEQLPGSFLTASFAVNESFEIEKMALIHWLNKTVEVTDATQRFLLQSLHIALLKDLNNALLSKKAVKHKSKANWHARLQYLLLAVAGAIYFGCEGFDGITAILSILSLKAAIFVFICGAIFSLLSIGVFYVFDLAEISKNLGVKIKNTPKIVDLYLREIEMIKAIRKTINANFSKKTEERLGEDLVVLAMLKERYIALDSARHSLKQSLEHPGLEVTKKIMAAITGVIFFSGGFFAGQTVAMAFALLFVASVAPTFWPVLLASVVVGMAALSVYWFVERPRFENLIGRWVGLDKEKINELCDEDAVEKELSKLNALSEKITSRQNTLNELANCKQKIFDLEYQFLSQQANVLAPEVPEFKAKGSSFVNNGAADLQHVHQAEPSLTRSVSSNSFFKADGEEWVPVTGEPPQYSNI